MTMLLSGSRIQVSCLSSTEIKQITKCYNNVLNGMIKMRKKCWQKSVSKSETQ